MFVAECCLRFASEDESLINRFIGCKIAKKLMFRGSLRWQRKNIVSIRQVAKEVVVVGFKVVSINLGESSALVNI